MGNNGGKQSGVEDNRRIVWIVYSKRDPMQRNNTRAFRDALQGDHAGRNLTTSVKEVSGVDVKGVLKKPPKNLILLSVDQAGADLLEHAINKQWIIQNELPRVLSVSFGTTRPQDMIPVLKQRPPMDQKDFCFGFRDVKDLDPNDFSNSDVLRQLITTLMASP